MVMNDRRTTIREVKRAAAKFIPKLLNLIIAC
jgi:hypothetical protein